MGAVSGELERAARDAGATVLTGAEVTAVDAAGRVSYRRAGAAARGHSKLGARQRGPRRPGPAAGSTGCVPTARPSNPNHAREGAQVKVNLLLKRLPRLLD